MRWMYRGCRCHLDYGLFPFFIFYVLSLSFAFSPITCIESTLFLILTLTTYELFMPFTLLPFLHLSLTIFLLRFYLHYVCLFSLVPLRKLDTFLLLMYVPGMDLNS